MIKIHPRGDEVTENFYLDKASKFLEISEKIQ
jgi:hypothetical protein